VTPVSAAEFEELIEYRAALLGVVFPRFVERHTSADRKVLRDYLEHMQELAQDDARAFEFVEVADRSLLYVAMQSGNRHIARAMSPLSLQLLRYYAIGVRTPKQRRQLLGWWADAIRFSEARDVNRFMALAAQSRGAVIAKSWPPCGLPRDRRGPGPAAGSRIGRRDVGRAPTAWLPAACSSAVRRRPGRCRSRSPPRWASGS